jgi:hypothetical protein
MDYFEKGLQVFFPKNNLYMQMDSWMNFFVTCSKKYLKIPQCIIFFFLIIIELIWINFFYKLIVSFWKLIKILNQHQKLNFHIF